MLVGRFSIKLYNFTRKSPMTGSGAGSNVVSSYGEATKMAGLAKVGKSRPRKGAEGQTLEGIGVAFSRLPKNVSNDPSFFFFPSLSRLSCVSLQIFFPRCRCSRFAIPTVPQFMQVLQSGQIACPSASKTPIGWSLYQQPTFSTAREQWEHTSSES